MYVPDGTAATARNQSLISIECHDLRCVERYLQQSLTSTPWCSTISSNLSHINLPSSSEFSKTSSFLQRKNCWILHFLLQTLTLLTNVGTNC